MPTDPHTDAEWQDTVDAAQVLLLIDSARLYGLIRTDMRINTDRCQAILTAGRDRSITPSQNALQRLFNTTEGDVT